MTTGGTWTCGGMGLCHMLALALGLSAWYSSAQGLRTFGMSFPFRDGQAIVNSDQLSHVAMLLWLSLAQLVAAAQQSEQQCKWSLLQPKMALCH